MAWARKIREFLQNAASACLPFVPSVAEKQQKRLKAMLENIRKFPEGAEQLRFIEEKEVKIIFSRDTRFASYSTATNYSDGKCTPVPKTQVILFNPDQDDNLSASNFFHEARHMQQVFSGVIRPGRQVSPFDLALYIRMLEADAQACSVWTAFKNKVDGRPLLFDGIESGTGYELMCQVAEREYAKDPASLHDGRLKRMLFDAWFRETGFDVKQTYDETTISTDWPCGIYATDMAQYGFSKSPLTAADIEKIGVCGGEEVNYLTLPGFRSLDDLYYKEGFSERHQKQLRELTSAWEKLFLPGQNSAPQKSPDSGLGI